MPFENDGSGRLLDSVDDRLAEVERRLSSGELDGSGRFYTDEELATGAATGGMKKREPKKPEPKAQKPAA